MTIEASLRAEDGSWLRRVESLDAPSVDALPSDAQVQATVQRVIDDLLALRSAPVGEPFVGPAILEGRAAGVFFHEVFGHRVEGHRQKDDQEGQTFAKKIGQRVMPEFVDVYDDPTISMLNGVPLNGFYRYDNEAVGAQRVDLVDHGVLRAFLMSRSPVHGFAHSNGHGRGAPGMSVVARQGNLIVHPQRVTTSEELKAQLLAEVKRQGKPYGLRFVEVEGGYTNTERNRPQSFKVIPILVYRVYPDGHEQLVRGLDLEGTPLSALAVILGAGGEMEVFNGYCGAESGWVPVSAASPSLLVKQIEVARKEKGHAKPPLAAPPPLVSEGRTP